MKKTSCATYGWRAFAVGVALAAFAVVLADILRPDWMHAHAILFAVATILGAPIFVTLGGAALILLWGDAIPIEMIRASLTGIRSIANVSSAWLANLSC